MFLTNYLKIDWEQIVYQTTALKNQKKKILERLKKEKRVNKPMLYSLIMSNNCLLTLVKNVIIFVNLESFI